MLAKELSGKFLFCINCPVQGDFFAVVPLPWTGQFSPTTGTYFHNNCKDCKINVAITLHRVEV
jgi:hypothetical protein